MDYSFFLLFLETALLATRYATLTTKLRQTSDRSVTNEQKLLNEIKTHSLKMETATKKLISSEKDKLGKEISFNFTIIYLLLNILL